MSTSPLVENGLQLAWWPRPQSVPPGAVVATGVFDLLHVGHIRFLTAIRQRGRPLLLGLEDDYRTRARKGAGRPVTPERERAEVLSALRVVDGVFLIHGDPAIADWPSYARLLAPLRPAAIAYTEGDPHTAAKQRAAAALEAEAWQFPLTEHRSTTAILAARQAGTPSPIPSGPSR